MPHLRFRSIHVLAMLLSTFAIAPVANASSITITFDHRDIDGKAVVFATADSFNDPASTPVWTATDSADLVASGATSHTDATQTSSVESPTLGGTGGVNVAFTSPAGAGAGHAEGQSFYDVRFDLTEAFMYSWSASISAAFAPGQALTELSDADAQAFLYDLDTNAFISRISVSANASKPVVGDATAGAGLLLPGSYWLVGQAAAGSGVVASGRSFNANSSFDMALTLTPLNPTAVPEPATLTLVGCGAVAAMLRRRRR